MPFLRLHFFFAEHCAQFSHGVLLVALWRRCWSSVEIFTSNEKERIIVLWFNQHWIISPEKRALVDSWFTGEWLWSAWSGEMSVLQEQSSISSNRAAAILTTLYYHRYLYQWRLGWSTHCLQIKVKHRIFCIVVSWEASIYQYLIYLSIVIFDHCYLMWVDRSN